MSQALYRKYRSKSLKEIVGQEHVTKTLAKALETGRISHAYLFTGPRGVGKTSIARILAHEINKLPYQEGETHIDIIEIDAASNNGVEDIRDIREKAYIAPANASFKVYIIDEVHMLSKAAFNALLKILEEPPAHVVFILATTEVHKLPETIISRTQRYVFKPVEQDKVIGHLKDIAKNEGISITDGALELIAEHGEGSFRDSISLLDQVRNYGANVDETTIQTMLGIAPKEACVEVLESLSGHDTSALVQRLYSLQGQGFQAGTIAKQLSELLRSSLINNQTYISNTQTLQLLQDLLDIPSSFDPNRLLEITLLKYTIKPSEVAVAPLIKTTKAAPQTKTPKNLSVAEPVVKTAIAAVIPDKPLELEEPEAVKTVVTNVDATEKLETIPPQEAQTVEVSMTGEVDATCWPAVLAALKQKYNTLYGVIKTAKPKFDTSGKLELTFAFAFHQKRINDAKNKKIVADTIQQVTGQLVEITCLHDKNIAVRTYSGLPALPTEDGAVVHNVGVKSAANPTLSAVSTIFGGGEVLPS